MQNDSSAVFREIAGAVLSEGSELSFRAGGRSMSPFILDNEIVIIEPPPMTLRVGDVILFECKSGHLILHRIVKKTKNSYVTRGDANCHADETVLHSSVLGKAFHVVGGLNLHLRFPLNRLVAHLLNMREYPVLFNLIRLPGSLLLGGLDLINRFRFSTGNSNSD